MLAHIPEPAAIIIPIATEVPMHAMRMVGFIRCRPQPQIIIEILRDRLRGCIDKSGPAELQGESLALANNRAERTA